MSDDLTADLSQLVTEQEQMRRTAGTYDGLADQPGLTASLALSGASDSEIQSVAGFAKGLRLSQQVLLARQSGVRLDLSDEDRGLLAAVGTHYDDVDFKSFDGMQFKGGQGGFLGRVSDIVNRTTQLPVVKQVFALQDRAYDVSNSLYRMGEQSPLTLQGLTNYALGDPGADRAEDKATMASQGYDRDILGTLAFYSRGKQQFHGLDDLRLEYDPEKVELAKEYLIDPEAFMGNQHSTEELIKRDNLIHRDQGFQSLVREVDSRHLSPGRDLANALQLDPNTAARISVTGIGTVLANITGDKAMTVDAFTAVSGSADAVWSFAADPTIIGGKARAVYKTARYGVKQLSDAGRVESLMTGNRAIKRGWTALLDDAKVMRSGDKAEAAAAYARVRARTPELAPMLDEINGGGLRQGKTIDTYEDLVEHVTGTTALLRMRNGLATREAPLMPGALSGHGYRAVKGALAAAATRRGVRVIDLEGRAASRIVAGTDDAVSPTGEDATGLAKAIGHLADAKGVGEQANKWRRTRRGRASTLINRMFTLLPEHNVIDLKSGQGAEDIRRFAALFMPKAHANALAARYAVAPLGERRAIAEAAYDQVLHAAGIPTTTSGKRWMKEQETRRAKYEQAAYDASGQGRDKIVGTDGEPTRRAGLYAGQMNDNFLLPDFAELRRISAKVSIYDHVLRSGMESSVLDRVMHTVRTGWLTNPASAQRNALEAWLSAKAQGLTGAELAKARAGLSSERARRAAERLDEIASQVNEEFRPHATTVHGVFLGRVLSGMRAAERATGHAVAGDEMLTRAREIVDAQMAGELRELEALTGLGTRGAHQSVDDAVEMMDRGYKVSPVRFKRQGYTLDKLEGLAGLRYWQAELGRRFTGTDGAYVLRATVEGTGTEIDHAAGRYLLGPANEHGAHPIVPAGPDKPHGYGSRENTIEVMSPNIEAPGRAALRGLYTKAQIAELESMTVDGLAKKIQDELGITATIDETRKRSQIKRDLLNQLGIGWARRNDFHAIVQTGKAGPRYFPLADTAMEVHVPAKERLVRHLLSDDYKATRARMERFDVLRDGTKVGDDKAMIRRAAEELADDQIVDMRALITGRSGDIHTDLVEKLSTLVGDEGRLTPAGVPSVKWLDRFLESAMPERVIQPQYVADLDGGAGHAANLVQAMGDAGYQYAVARPLGWMATLPIFHANYARAHRQVEAALGHMTPVFKDQLAAAEKRLNRARLKHEWLPDEKAVTELAEAKRLVEQHSVSAENWAEHVRGTAMMHAMDATASMIDNPRVRSQMSLITRNMFNFWRAQEDFARRWARNLKEDPALLRKAQITVEGGMHTGLVYQDEQGELVFAYPGSGYALQAIGRTLDVFGLAEYEGLGATPNLSTKLEFLNSGLDRPFLPTTSPVASLPLRIIKTVAHDPMWAIEAQQITEGGIGASRGWWSQALPSPAYRAMAAMSTNEREGQFASASRNAMLNLYAAGKMPEPTIDPITGEMVPPSPDEQDRFKQRIRTGVRNHLVSRALLATFLPGAPGNPSEETDASRANELEKAAFNTVSLQGAFRTMVGRYGYQKAMAVWAETHPDDLIYTVSTTEGKGGTGGYLAPTDEVLGWLKDNGELADKFPSLTAYFAPDGPGDFSQDAWRVELELGLRQHKTLDVFYRDVVVKNAETTYYAMRDKRDALVGAAKAAGDDDQAKALATSFSQWSTEWKNANPYLIEKWQAGDVAKARAAQLVTDVGRLADSPMAADLDPNGDLMDLVTSFRNKQQWDSSHKGRTDDAIAERDGADISYKEHVARILTRSPYLLPLYRGIFDKVE